MYSFGLIIAAGYGWRFFDPAGIDRQKARHALSVTVLHFFLPALAFDLVAGARIDRSFTAVPLAAAATTLSGSPRDLQHTNCSRGSGPLTGPRSA